MINNYYTGSGCYRFKNVEGQVIYVGSAKNINRRINSHFSSNGHLGKSVYDLVAIVEITKTNDYATALALEQYLINKYKPQFNKRDKSGHIGSKVVKNEDYYNKLEKWIIYKKFKQLDIEKINYNNKRAKVVAFATYFIFIITVLGLLYSF